jgi:hypothetical protein
MGKGNRRRPAKRYEDALDTSLMGRYVLKADRPNVSKPVIIRGGIEAMMHDEILMANGSKGLEPSDNPLEHKEQATLFFWAERMFNRGVIPEIALMFAVPNGNGVNVGTRIKMWREGVKGGVPDIEWPIKRRGFTGLHIELKRRKDYEISTKQLKYAAALREEGRAVYFCIGWEQAAWVILWYYGWTNSPKQDENGEPEPEGLDA